MGGVFTVLPQFSKEDRKYAGRIRDVLYVAFATDPFIVYDQNESVDGGPLQAVNLLRWGVWLWRCLCICRSVAGARQAAASSRIDALDGKQD